MAWARGGYPYSKAQRAEIQNEGFLGAGGVAVQARIGCCVICKKPLKYSTVDAPFWEGLEFFFGGSGVTDGQAPRCISIATGDVITYFYVTPELHIYIVCGRERKRLVRRAFMMEGFAIPPTFAFLGRGSAGLKGSEWSDRQSVWYQRYLIPETHELADAIALACRVSIHAGSRADALPVRKAGGSRRADIDVENSKQKSSKNRDEKNSGISDSSLETGSIPKKKWEQRKK